MEQCLLHSKHLINISYYYPTYLFKWPVKLAEFSSDPRKVEISVQDLLSIRYIQTGCTGEVQISGYCPTTFLIKRILYVPEIICQPERVPQDLVFTIPADSQWLQPRAQFNKSDSSVTEILQYLGSSLIQK